MTNVRGYVRVSQTGRDESIDDQIESLLSYAVRNDIPLAEDQILNDGENTSGFDTDRGGFSTLLEELSSNELDIIITRDRSRLSRDFDTRIRLLADFRDTGTEWHVVEENGRLNLQDTKSAGMEAISAAMDHEKKRAEIERSKQAIKSKQERGDYLGRPRYGTEYSDDKRRLVPNDDWTNVAAVLWERANGASFPEIERRVGVNRATVMRIWERRDWYLDLAKQV